jgi:hypothetical protein
MINVVVRDLDKVKKRFSFDESRDEEAMKKALVECDRLTWSYEVDNVITLDQNGRLLRFLTDDQVGWQFINNNGIYDGLVGER